MEYEKSDQSLLLASIVEEFPKSVTHKTNKSIDRICAKLKLNANGVEDKPTISAALKSKTRRKNRGKKDKHLGVVSNGVNNLTKQEGKKGTQMLNKMEKNNNHEKSQLGDYPVIIMNEQPIDVGEQEDGNFDRSRDTLQHLQKYQEESSANNDAYPCDVLTTETVDQVSMTSSQDSEQQPDTKMVDVKLDDDKNKLKPRNPTQYNNWHYTDMLKAINAVQSKNLSMTAAAKKYCIPRTTLRHYLNDGTNKESRLACFSLPTRCEDELLQFVLKNRSKSEKVLYKMIADKAKNLSELLITSAGEKKRHSPTPAWIRRFVYRHKQLYDLFPTCLTKYEHPLHGGKKVVDHETLAANDSYIRQAHNSEALVYSDDPKMRQSHGTSKYSPLLTRRDHYRMFNYDSVPHGTEIIFPTHGNNSIFHRSDILKELHSTSDNTSNSSDEFNDGRQNETKSYDSSVGSNSMVIDNERLHYDRPSRMVHVSNDNETEGFPHSIRNNFQPLNEKSGTPNESQNFVVKVEKFEPTKSDPLKQLDHCDSNMDVNLLKYAPQKHPYINLDSTSFISTDSSSSTRRRKSMTEIYPPETVRTLNHNTNAKYVERILCPPNADEYQRTETGCFEETDFFKMSEGSVAIGLLQSMENSLGNDYIQLFTERYQKNKKLERLYSKWVMLKAEVEILDKKL